MVKGFREKKRLRTAELREAGYPFTVAIFNNDEFNAEREHEHVGQCTDVQITSSFARNFIRKF